MSAEWIVAFGCSDCDNRGKVAPRVGLEPNAKMSANDKKENSMSNDKFDELCEEIDAHARRIVAARESARQITKGVSAKKAIKEAVSYREVPDSEIVDVASMVRQYLDRDDCDENVIRDQFAMAIVAARIAADPNMFAGDLDRSSLKFFADDCYELAAALVESRCNLFF